MSRQYTVACLAGEGVGAELMAEATRALRAVSEPGRSTDEKISAVQYLRFPLPAEAKAALATVGTPVAIEIDHPSYRHRVSCGEQLRASLAADYTP